MDRVPDILMMIHILSAILWIGAVFMGSVIDWPAIRSQFNDGKFPFRFIVGQGSRVFPWVYVGILSQIVSGIGLVFYYPPATGAESAVLALKTACLVTMTGLTMYGTFSTWPKLQVSTDGEAFVRYRFYILRAYVTCSAGMVGAAAGVIMSRFI